MRIHRECTICFVMRFREEYNNCFTIFFSFNVYRRLYKSHCLKAFFDVFEFESMIEFYFDCVENRLVTMFSDFEFDLKFSTCVHVVVLKIDRRLWTQIKTFRTCFYCLRRKSEHVFTCEHAICDVCLKIFEYNLEDRDLHFKIFECLFCLNQDTMIDRIKSVIVDSRILSIDEKDVRDVISLKFLNLLQNVIDFSLFIQDLFDQTFEINFDKWLIASNLNNWLTQEIWLWSKCFSNNDIFFAVHEFSILLLETFFTFILLKNEVFSLECATIFAVDLSMTAIMLQY